MDKVRRMAARPVAPFVVDVAIPTFLRKPCSHKSARRGSFGFLIGNTRGFPVSMLTPMKAGAACFTLCCRLDSGESTAHDLAVFARCVEVDAMRPAVAHVDEGAVDDATLLVETLDVEVFRDLVVAGEVTAEMERRVLTLELHTGIVNGVIRPILDANLDRSLQDFARGELRRESCCLHDVASLSSFSSCSFSFSSSMLIPAHLANKTGLMK